MSKEIIAVYQDCVLCGVKGRRKIADLAAEGVNIRKVSFITEEGRELCAEAIAKGIGGMPFYVCEGDFATKIEALVNSAQKKKKKVTKKATKKPSKEVVEEKDNGADSEI